jgi:hypothetical protein
LDPGERREGVKEEEKEEEMESGKEEDKEDQKEMAPMEQGTNLAQ